MAANAIQQVMSAVPTDLCTLEPPQPMNLAALIMHTCFSVGGQDWADKARRRGYRQVLMCFVSVMLSCYDWLEWKHCDRRMSGVYCEL